jgi:tryptophan synthase beta chain
MSVQRVMLSAEELPAAWYNVRPDLPAPLPPPLSAQTGRPLAPADLERLLPAALAEQEFSVERWIEIPRAVREGLALWRPTPLVRARRLEQALKTPARIYFKDESCSPPGSHKANTAVVQAYYARQEGIRRLVTETGAGQWGCSLALACAMFDLKCRVFMVKLSFEQRPYRATMMRLWRAEVVASPSPETETGRRARGDDPDSPGSLGIAISEAVETASGDAATKYAMGSVLNHVMLHQTVIGLEARRQLELAGERPDVIIGCIGGGSNFAGLAFPFLADKLGGRPIRLVAAEPRACPSLTRGRFRYDLGGTTEATPLVKMYTLGHDLVPPRILAGGLRYHGVAPLVSLAASLGLVEARALHQTPCLDAARLLAATEGIIPAMETSYAVRAAIEEAERCRETGTAECIVFCLSGHGLCELGSYDRFLAGEVDDVDCPPHQIEAALARLPADR